MHFKFTTTNSIVCGAFILMYRPISSQYAANVQLLKSTWQWKYRHQLSPHSFNAIFMVVIFHGVKTWYSDITFRTNITIIMYDHLLVAYRYLSQNVIAFIRCLQKLCCECVRYVDNINCDNCYTKQNGRTINCNHNTHCICYYVCCVYERMHLSLRAITIF